MTPSAHDELLERKKIEFGQHAELGRMDVGDIPAREPDDAPRHYVPPVEVVQRIQSVEAKQARRGK